MIGKLENNLEVKTMKYENMDKGPVREKYWKELTDQEKIERLRFTIKQQQGFINDMARHLEQLVNHDHLNNKIVFRIKELNEYNYDRFELPKNGRFWIEEGSD